mgnify:CR=1 FL=1
MPNPAVNRTLHIKPRKAGYLERSPALRAGERSGDMRLIMIVTGMTEI